MTETIIELRDLSIGYGNKKVLQRRAELRLLNNTLFVFINPMKPYLNTDK